MAGYKEHYNVLLVDVRCNLVGEISLRSITKHHRTPCNVCHLLEYPSAEPKLKFEIAEENLLCSTIYVNVLFFIQKYFLQT